jgi:hypothetical protein
MTPEKLCIGDAKHLLAFTKEVFKIEFEQKPEYSKLKSLLVNVLLEHNVCPSIKFDWSKFT